MYIHVCVYMWREIERERKTGVCMCVHIYVLISVCLHVLHACMFVLAGWFMGRTPKSLRSKHPCGHSSKLATCTGTVYVLHFFAATLKPSDLDLTATQSCISGRTSETRRTKPRRAASKPKEEAAMPLLRNCRVTYFIHTFDHRICGVVEGVWYVGMRRRGA